MNSRRKRSRKVFAGWSRTGLGMFLLLTGLVFSGMAWGQTGQPTVRIAASPTRVYEGESFRFQILLDDFAQPVLPDTQYLESEFRIRYLGEQERNRTSIAFVNGRQTRTEEHGMTYNYVLTPLRTGTVRIEAPKVAGGRVVGRPVDIEVIPPSNQDEIILELTSSAAEVYPLIPFDVTLSVFVRELPGKFANRDPVETVCSELGPCTLEIPWLEDERLPQGITATTSWQDWITGFHRGTGGFQVNDIREESSFDIGFSIFGSRRPSTVFLPEGKRVTRTTKDGSEDRYVQYDFKRTFTGQIPGEILFDAITLKGPFVRAEGDKFTQTDLYTLSPSLSVRVREVPEEGRPADYIGAFGTFTWKADLVPDKVHVGEAMTLVLTLAGKGSVLNVKQPDLTAVSGIADRFKIYPPSEEIGEGTAKFTWSLRPLQEGKFEFPPIPISYFDGAREQYVSVSTDPIPIEVEKSVVLETGPTGPAPRPVSGSVSLTRSESGIYANRTSPGPMGNVRRTPARWGRDMAILLTATLAASLVWLALRSERFSRHCRRNDLIRKARNWYEEGLSILRSGSPDHVTAAGSDLKNALLVPLTEWWNRPVETLTEADAITFFGEWDVPATDFPTGKLVAFLRELEGLRYGSDQEAMKRLQESAGPLMEQWFAFVQQRKNRRILKAAVARMEKNSVKNRRGSGLTGMILVLALAGLWTSGGCARSESAVRNEDSFREALRLFDEAQSEQTDTEQGKARASELFRKSAAVYEGLIQNGVVNGPILYNQGNAWWRAGEPAKALACWREAQRYSPRDPYLAANLAVLGVDSRPAKRTHWENILFWQNWLSSPAKFSWSFDLAVLSAVTFLMWLFLPAGARTEEKDRFPLKRMCGKASLVLAVLFAVMTISAFYDWNRFDRYGHGIVAAHETVARKGNSLSYEPAFSEPLPQLSEVTVLSHEGDWLRVRADDGQDCWLPAADVVVF